MKKKKFSKKMIIFTYLCFLSDFECVCTFAMLFFINNRELKLLIVKFALKCRIKKKSSFLYIYKFSLAKKGFHTKSIAF